MKKNLHFQRYVGSWLVLVGALTCGDAIADCPAPYDDDDCTVISEVCQDGTELIQCDLYREEGDYGGTAWAVLNVGGTVCDSDYEYCIFGTESTNTQFCCEWDASDETRLELWGTPQATDTLYFQYTSGGTTVNLDNWNTSSIPVFEGMARGRGVADYIHGSKVSSLTYHDELFGDDGSDTIYGYDGGDEIDGGEDNDFLYGGEGNDTIRGGDGLDELYGGSQDDTLQGDNDNDYLEGGDGSDHLYGGMNEDELNGGSAADYCYGGDDPDFILGGDGNDTLYGEGGDDELSGGANEDTMQGDDGEDILCGDDGDDTLRGNAGNDTLWGGNGSSDSGDGGGNTGAPGNTCDTGTTETRANCTSSFGFSRPCAIGP